MTWNSVLFYLVLLIAIRKTNADAGQELPENVKDNQPDESGEISDLEVHLVNEREADLEVHLVNKRDEAKPLPLVALPLTPMEWVVSDYSWRDGRANDRTFWCSTPRLWQLAPGVEKEAGVDIELELKMGVGSAQFAPYVFQLADSLTCVKLGDCIPFVTIGGYSQNGTRSLCVKVYGVANNNPGISPLMCSPYRNGKFKLSVREGNVTLTLNGQRMGQYLLAAIRFPLNYHVLYLAANRLLAPPERKAGEVPRGRGVCGVKVTWQRIAREASELVNRNYQWSDNNAAGPGQCQTTRLLNLKPPHATVTGVVIEMDIKALDELVFEIGGAYWTDGVQGGGDDAADIFYMYGDPKPKSDPGAIKVISSDGVMIARHPYTTPGKVKVILGNNKVKMEVNGEELVNLEQVALYTFPLPPDGLYFGINRAVSTRSPKRFGKGVCSVKITWLG